MSDTIHKLVITTMRGTQYSELEAGLLVGIAKCRAPFMDQLRLISQTLAELERWGCLKIIWEDDMPFDVSLTPIGQREATELEAQGIQPAHFEMDI